jgi:hypothetical protein
LRAAWPGELRTLQVTRVLWDGVGAAPECRVSNAFYTSLSTGQRQEWGSECAGAAAQQRQQHSRGSSTAEAAAEQR